ncbi:MAG: TonB-dependent receptor domain-containing protein, partial [Pyrinomonadaceae bacterium]
INVITKSGTNEFHGEAFEQYHGSGLSALNNIEKNNGLTSPAQFNRNQFGFDIGGPVLFPRFGEGDPELSYDGRNRTFFFYLFQGDRTTTGAQPGTTVRIPTPAGFAALNNVPLRDGQTASSRNAILNSISFLPSIYGLNPVFRGLNTQTINGAGIETGLTNIPITQPSNIYSHLIRIDHKLAENDNLTIRYSSNKRTASNVASNLQFGELFSGDQLILDQNVALSETHVFSPNMLNEFRFSYIRRNLNFPENDPTTPTSGITGNFTVGGAATFPQGRVQNSYQYSDTLSWLIGRHSLKFGADIRRIQLFNLSAFDSKGTFTFDNLQDFLNNNASTFLQALQTASFDARQTQQSYFAQDDFRITPNLTFNIGLRYEYSSVPFGFFGATDPQSLAALVAGPVQTDKNNFAPAIGFNYSPRAKSGILGKLFGDGTSVIRGGYR